MSKWSCTEIRDVSNGQWLIEPATDQIEFAGVAIDSRELSKSQFFFAFVGEHTDGHAYLRDAANAGVSLCIVSDADKVPTDLDVPVLVVSDALDAITALAFAWRERIKAKVIAVTGSNGKTTTCRMIHSVCAQSGRSHVSQKSFNNALGVPITILNTPEDSDYLVAELGTSSLGEIASRADLAKPDIAVITSIGAAHLEELGDRRGVAKEKAAIVHALRDGSTAVIPEGVAELEAAIESIAKNRAIVRIGGGSNVSVIESTSTHTTFSLNGDLFSIPMLGKHNAMNASMAVVVGRSLGISDESIAAGLRSAKLPEMRFDRIEIPTHTKPIELFNDAYNANPDSMRAALETFDSLEVDGPKVAVLAEMLELGDHGNAQHAAIVAGLIRYESIDRFVLVGKAFARAGRGTENNRITISETFDDHAMTTITRTIKPGSCVLLKGSRAMRLERIVYILFNQAAANPTADTKPQTHA